MDVTPTGLVECGFGGSHCEMVEIAPDGVEFCAVYPSVAMARRFRVREALLEIVKLIVGKVVRFLDSSNHRAHNQLKCTDC